MEDHKEIVVKDSHIIYIRHGQTNYNIICQSTSKEIARTLTDYLDCGLCPIGINQAKELSVKLSKLNIRYVFCSPLLRCLETCRISLGSMNDLNIYVHPYITETVNGVHDYSRNMSKKKLDYNKFNWKYFDEIYKDNISQENYFLDYIDGKNDHAQLCKQKLKELAITDPEYENKSKELLKEISSTFQIDRIRGETITHMFERNRKFKEFLKEFKLENDEKILVFTHSAFIKISTSKLAYTEDISEEIFPNDCYSASNCELIPINIKY